MNRLVRPSRKAEQVRETGRNALKFLNWCVIRIQNNDVGCALDQRKSQVVELRFFGGLNEVETALVLGLSERTIRNEWKLAKAWLYREISAE